jgi:hypothetical protein
MQMQHHHQQVNHHPHHTLYSPILDQVVLIGIAAHGRSTLRRGALVSDFGGFVGRGHAGAIAGDGQIEIDAILHKFSHDKITLSIMFVESAPGDPPHTFAP